MFLKAPLALPSSLYFKNFAVAIKRMNFWKALLKPIIITVSVFVAMGAWNDFLMTSLFLTKTDTRTLAIAIKTFLTNHSAEYTPMMAGLLLRKR